MKILHTADWHLGKKLEYIPRIEEQREVLQEILAIAEKEMPDAVLIAGDIFDSANPPIEALELFYQTAKKLARNGKCAVIGIAGNHDSPDRIEAPDPLARECGIILTGYPATEVKPFSLETGLALLRTDAGFIEVKLPSCDAPLRLLLTPYANEHRIRTYLGAENPEAELRNLLQEKWQNLADQYCDEKGVNILMTHLFVMKKGGEKPEESEDEKTVLMVGGAQEIYSENFPKQLQYVALGHIHRPQTIDKQYFPIVYSGSPLAYSMAEAGQEKYVILLNAEPNQPIQYQKISLKSGKQLVRKSFEDVSKAVEWLRENPNTIVELTIVTDTYLTAVERKALYDAHPHIFIHLQVKNLEKNATNSSHQLDLTRDIESIFIDYFQQKNKQVPNEQILNIFREILAEEG